VRASGDEGAFWNESDHGERGCGCRDGGGQASESANESSGGSWGGNDDHRIGSDGALLHLPHVHLVLSSG